MTNTLPIILLPLFPRSVQIRCHDLRLKLLLTSIILSPFALSTTYVEWRWKCSFTILHRWFPFTTSQTHDLSFDLEDWRAIRELDAETVAAERDDFFFEDECFWACGKELGEHADGLGCWGEGGHGSDGVCLMMVLMLMFA